VVRHCTGIGDGAFFVGVAFISADAYRSPAGSVGEKPGEEKPAEPNSTEPKAVEEKAVEEKAA
jgi:hypothetical protein